MSILKKIKQLIQDKKDELVGGVDMYGDGAEQMATNICNKFFKKDHDSAYYKDTKFNRWLKGKKNEKKE